MARGLLHPRMLSQASGSMAGNITRLPLPSSIFGRPWSLPSHTQDLAPPPWCTELRQVWSSCTLVLERLRLPLQAVDAQSECGASLDVQGRHGAACPRSGRLWSRAVGPERTLARVCREAGATVRCNVRLRDMNVVVSATDMRSIEVWAIGLPLHHGAQLAVDITLRSALTSASHACPSAATIDGAVLVKARADKERKYAELNEDCRLVVVGVEIGGRWSDEVVTFLDHRPLPSFGAARFQCGDVVGRACLQLHAGKRLHSFWFLRPRALAVWRVPHLTLLTCAVGFE